MAGRPQLSCKTGPTYKLAEYLNENWDTKVGRTNQDVADELGFRAANMISMWRTGRTPVSLEKLPDVARIMKTDLGELLPLYFEQTWGGREDGEELVSQFSKRVLTDQELPLIDAIRKFRKGKGMGFSQTTIEAIIAAIQTSEAAEKAAKDSKSKAI